MASIIQQLKGTAAEVAAKTYAVGVLVWNETAKRWHGGDGVTAGGIAMARYDERNDGALGFEQRVETGASNAVTVADIGRAIIGNRASAIAFNLAAAATLTSKFVAVFKNINAGPMTIVPNGAELIDGVNAAISVPTGSSVIVKGDGTSFRTFLSNGDVTGAAINGAAALTGANLADDDKIGVYDTSAAGLRGMSISELVAGIFKTARTIANAQFASASFKLFNAASTPRALLFNTTALTADRTITLLDSDVTLGTPVFLRQYESPEQTITVGGALSLSHGLGVEPKRIDLMLICKTADAGYAVNDKIFMPLAGPANTSNRGAQATWDSTTIAIRYGSDGTTVFSALNKGSGASNGLANGSWRMIVRAYA